MNTGSQIQEIRQITETLLSAEPDLFLVEIKMKPVNNIKMFIDGDQGISIEKLAQYNRRLYKQIEEKNIFPGGDFSLEVSSPGLDEPLKLYRQYVKNIGQYIEITEKDETKREGKLIEVTGQEVVIEEQQARPAGKNKSKAGQGKGKRSEVIQHAVPMENIKTIKIQIKF